MRPKGPAVRRPFGPHSTEDLSGNDHALDLAGSFSDGTQFNVAIELLDREILNEPVSTVNLNGLVGHSHRDLSREELRDGRLFGGPGPFLFEVCCLKGQEAGGLNLRSHVCKLELNRLELRDGAAKLLSLLRVPERCFVCPLCHSDCKSGNRDSSPIQNT